MDENLTTQDSEEVEIALRRQKEREEVSRSLENIIQNDLISPKVTESLKLIVQRKREQRIGMDEIWKNKNKAKVKKGQLKKESVYLLLDQFKENPYKAEWFLRKYVNNCATREDLVLQRREIERVISMLFKRAERSTVRKFERYVIACFLQQVLKNFGKKLKMDIKNMDVREAFKDFRDEGKLLAEEFQKNQ